MTHPEQAQIHLDRLDRLKPVFDHTCVCCEQGFDSGHGFECVQYDEDKICKTCFNWNHHLPFYQVQGLNDRIINQLKFIAI